jgi:hypothetical protein
MSKRSRNQERSTRAMRAKKHVDDRIFEHITRVENKKPAKKPAPESNSQSPADAPVREAPYDRLLRRLREERQGN